MKSVIYSNGYLCISHYRSVFYGHKFPIPSNKIYTSFTLGRKDLSAK